MIYYKLNSFQLTGINPTFLEIEVDEWDEDPTYIQMKSMVEHLHVINDAAERSVKFGTDFTGVLTKNETIRQHIMQTVELSRRAFPRRTKKSFLGTHNSASALEEILEGAGYDAR